MYKGAMLDASSELNKIKDLLNEVEMDHNLDPNVAKKFINTTKKIIDDYTKNDKVVK